MEDRDRTRQQLINDVQERRKQNAEPLGAATPAKLSEEELHRSKEFVEAVMNSIAESISIIDTRDYKVIGANQALFEILKRREKEVIGKTCYELTHSLSAWSSLSVYCQAYPGTVTVTVIRSAEVGLLKHSSLIRVHVRRSSPPPSFRSSCLFPTPFSHQASHHPENRPQTRIGIENPQNTIG